MTDILQNGTVSDELNETFRKLIDLRDDEHFVMPLYVVVFNKRYLLTELDEISDLSKETFRVGFGSSMERGKTNSFNASLLYKIPSIVSMFEHENDKYLKTNYIVFESDRWTHESDEHMKIFDDMNRYYDLLQKRVENIVNTNKQNAFMTDITHITD